MSEFASWAESELDPGRTGLARRLSAFKSQMRLRQLGTDQGALIPAR
jgi:hypothetical protein